METALTHTPLEPHLAATRGKTSENATVAVCSDRQNGSKRSFSIPLIASYFSDLTCNLR